MSYTIKKEEAIRLWQLKADLPQVTLRSIVAGLAIGYVVPLL